jgi:hypothetical protein
MISISRAIKTICIVLVLMIPALATADVKEPDELSDTTSTAAAEHGAQKTIDQIALEMSNPLSTLFSFPLEYQFRTYQGDIPGAGDHSSSSLILGATLPFLQRDVKGWIFRFALPYIDDQPIYWVDRGYAEWRIRQQDPTAKGEGFWDDTHGHTDAMSFDLVYGGVRDSGLILSYGIAGILPTTSDTSNGRQQLILGPEVNIGKMTDRVVYGALISHIIDVAEKRDKGTPDTTQTTIQAYFSYGLGNGWQVISNPTITYDWEGDSGNKLNLPLGVGIAKTTRIGTMPLRMAAEVQNYVVTTDRFGSEWLFKFTITPVIPGKYTRY